MSDRSNWKNMLAIIAVALCSGVWMTGCDQDGRAHNPPPVKGEISIVQFKDGKINKSLDVNGGDRLYKAVQEWVDQAGQGNWKSAGDDTGFAPAILVVFDTGSISFRNERIIWSYGKLGESSASQNFIRSFNEKDIELREKLKARLEEVPIRSRSRDARDAAGNDTGP